jgi:hypothetical protein
VCDWLHIAWDAPRLVASEAKTATSWVFGQWAGFHAGRFFTGWMRGSEANGYTLVTRHDRLDGSWNAEAEVGPMRWSSYAAPKLAAAANGDKVLVWREGDDKSSRIVARSFDGNTGWGPVAVVAGDLAPRYLGCIDIDAHDHDVSIDASGNAVAVWEERIPQPNTQATMKVRSSRLLKGAAPVAGWTPPVQLDDGRGHAGQPVVAATGTSSAVSLWHVEGPSSPPFLQASELKPADN